MWKACHFSAVTRGILAVLFGLFVPGSDSLTVRVDSESPATLISGQDGHLVCSFTPASPTFIVTWRKETYTVYTKLQVMGAVRSTDVLYDRRSVLTSVAYGSLVGRAEIVDDVTLKIKGVQHSDAATYECEVSDMSGSDSGESSAFVEVFVVDDPDPPECTLSSDNPIAGTNASLSCSSIAGRPASSLQWYQQLGDGTLREVGNNMADGSVLTHDLQVTKQDGGTVYICQEEHPEPITSKNCSVTLAVSHLDTPVINATSPLAIHEGTQLFLQCTVDSSPAADVMWLLPSGESVHGADLELPAVGRRHGGVYSCVANMTVGGVELVAGETVEVTVTGLDSSTFKESVQTEQVLTGSNSLSTSPPETWYETTTMDENATETSITSETNGFKDQTAKRTTDRPSTVDSISETQDILYTQTLPSQAKTTTTDRLKQTMSVTRANRAPSIQSTTSGLDASTQPSAVGVDLDTSTATPTMTTGNDFGTRNAPPSDVGTQTQARAMAKASTIKYAMTPATNTLTPSTATMSADLATSTKTSGVAVTQTMIADVAVLKHTMSTASIVSTTQVRAMANDTVMPTYTDIDTVTQTLAVSIDSDTPIQTQTMPSDIDTSTQANTKSSEDLHTTRQTPTMTTTTSDKSTQTLLMSSESLKSTTSRSDWVKSTKGSPKPRSSTSVTSTTQAVQVHPQAVSQTVPFRTESGSSRFGTESSSSRFGTGSSSSRFGTESGSSRFGTESGSNGETDVDETEKGFGNRYTASPKPLHNTARIAAAKNLGASTLSSAIISTKTVPSQRPEVITDKEDAFSWEGTSQYKTSSSSTPPLDRSMMPSSPQSSSVAKLEVTATSAPRSTKQHTTYSDPTRTAEIDASVSRSSSTDIVYGTVERIFPTDEPPADRSVITSTLPSADMRSESSELQHGPDTTTFGPAATNAVYNKTEENSTSSLAPTSSSTPGDKCLKDYVLYDGSCFKAFPKAVTYSEAEAICGAEGGIVAPAKTEELLKLIRKLVYSTWVPGEPNNYQGTQHCGRYWASMEQWDDVVCYVRYLFVCQIGQTTTKTQSYTPSNVVQTSAVRITRSPNRGITPPTPLHNDNKTTLKLNQVRRPTVKESLPGWKVGLIIIFTIVGLAALMLLVAFFTRSKFFRFKRSIMPVPGPPSTQEYGSQTKLDP
ncbi:hypothetical protein Bbelb_149610 [Branchiostoma belcheri]|nr:hypothetical protein Bbelb_149610 [Branchiostoma belcheri]